MARPSRLPTLCVLVVLSSIAFAGCIDGDEGRDGPAPLESLEVYEYRYGGDDVALPGIAHGWMARITNPGDSAVAFAVEPLGNGTRYGPAGDAGWEVLKAPQVDLLAEGESKVYLFQNTWTEAPNETGFQVHVFDRLPSGDGSETEDLRVMERGEFTREIAWKEEVTKVAADQHVKTATVGVWLNGTSFYTNIAHLNDDPEFPLPDNANRSDFDGAPLPIYVYSEDRSDQPPGSKDTCHFTTITGYNALLKTQADQGTNVRWLAPEEAYTRPGAEEHWLYGDVLIFMNTIVAHDGPLGPADRVPNPQGDCFNTNNTARPPAPPPSHLPFH